MVEKAHSSPIAMTACPKCREERKKQEHNISSRGPNHGMKGAEQQLKEADDHTGTPNELSNISIDDRQRFETSLYDKMNISLLRHMPKGVLTDLQARANSGSKTAENLLHILWNPTNREKLIPGCYHRRDELSQLIDELVALYGPRSGG